MPEFSESDIEKAKRRVLEMKNKASHFVENSDAQSPPEPNTPEKKENKAEPENNFDNKDDNDSDKSSFLILILILILSHEGADDRLILALLYLLL